MSIITYNETIKLRFNYMMKILRIHEGEKKGIAVRAMFAPSCITKTTIGDDFSIDRKQFLFDTWVEEDDGSRLARVCI